MKRSARWLQSYGPWVLVTGASSGIGQAFARELAEAGMHLVLVARRTDLLNALAEELQGKYGIMTEVIGADLATDAGQELVLKQSAQRDIGLLLASAGFGTSGPFLQSELAKEVEMLQVNCQALFTQTHAFARRFAERKRGGIILMSSIVSFQGMPYAGHYAATKAYVQTLAEALHIELKPSGVDVLSVAPGPTNSGFGDHADMEMGKVLKPKTVARGAIKALGKRGQVRPGFLSKLLTYSQTGLPRWARAQIMGTVMKGMTKNKPAA